MATKRQSAVVSATRVQRHPRMSWPRRSSLLGIAAAVPVDPSRAVPREFGSEKGRVSVVLFKDPSPVDLASSAL
jgi:hypothetical protein